MNLCELLTAKPKINIKKSFPTHSIFYGSILFGIHVYGDIVTVVCPPFMDPQFYETYSTLYEYTQEKDA